MLNGDVIPQPPPNFAIEQRSKSSWTQRKECFIIVSRSAEYQGIYEYLHSQMKERV